MKKGLTCFIKLGEQRSLEPFLIESWKVNTRSHPKSHKLRCMVQVAYVFLSKTDISFRQMIPYWYTGAFGKVSAHGVVGGGRVVQWCWVNFQCRGVLLIWMTVE